MIRPFGKETEVTWILQDSMGTQLLLLEIVSSMYSGVGSGEACWEEVVEEPLGKDWFIPPGTPSRLFMINN